MRLLVSLAILTVFCCIQFSSAEDCFLPVVCRRPVSAGNCSQSLTRYYFDIESGECKSFIYTGCGGTVNRFGTLKKCVNRCVKNNCETGTGGTDTGPGTDSSTTTTTTTTKKPVYLPRCILPRVVGNCGANLPRFHFDIFSRTCKPFNYSGCGGNLNNFKTVAECQGFCLR